MHAKGRGLRASRQFHNTPPPIRWYWGGKILSFELLRKMLQHTTNNLSQNMGPTCLPPLDLTSPAWRSH